MTATLRIRPAAADDAAVLLDLLLRAFGEYEGRLDPPSGANRETVATIAGKLVAGGAFICRDDALPVGCVFYAPERAHLYVGRLSVPPEQRKRGIGDMLLRAAEDHARALALPIVRLRVRIALAALHAYYAARGYVSIGSSNHPGYSQPTFIEMEKRLA